MCKCTPNIRTPFCGKPGCEWPPRTSKERLVLALLNTIKETRHGFDEALTMIRSALELPSETGSFQAPIAKLTVHEDDSLTASLYAPGLPPGEFDLYCEPPSPSGQKVPFFETTARQTLTDADLAYIHELIAAEDCADDSKHLRESAPEGILQRLVGLPEKTSACTCPRPGTSSSSVDPFCPIHVPSLKAGEQQ